MTAAEQAGLAEVAHRELYGMVERLVALFGLGGWAGEAVFVQAFQDVVLRFTAGRTTDLHSFLAWWEKNSDKQFVSAPEGGEAVRIMTIHKSKGLDFPVVVIPFCDWEFESVSSPSRRTFLWCEPRRAPFNAFPLLPLEYGARLGRSVFATEFFTERMHQYIDCLNVAYVAFTRAEHELICFAPKAADPKKAADGVDKVGSLDALLWMFLQQSAPDGGGDIDLAAHYVEGEGRFELGADTAGRSADDRPAAAVGLRHYPVTDPAGRLQVRRQGLDFWLEGQQLTDSAVNYGTIMHRLLQSVRHRDDAERALRECCLGGLVAEGDLPPGAGRAGTLLAVAPRGGMVRPRCRGDERGPDTHSRWPPVPPRPGGAARGRGYGGGLQVRRPRAARLPRPGAAVHAAGGADGLPGAGLPVLRVAGQGGGSGEIES